ncbi:MAG: hypothetical protein IJR17_03535 [Clostridia bacterium]|nr:hypothetical protein [Clostridia bacterium]
MVEDEDEDEDDYEEYEPTPPRRRQAAKTNGQGSGNLVPLLVICLVVILALIACIIAFCNIKGGATKERLPEFLQFNCAGKETAEADPAVQPTEEATQQPTDAPAVTGEEIDFGKVTLENDVVNQAGDACIQLGLWLRPSETVTIVLPNQDDWVYQNTENANVPFSIKVPKVCYYPNTVLEQNTYTVTPEVIVTHADGSQESLQVASFDLTFPTLQLVLIEPNMDTIPAEGIMAQEGNELVLKGNVGDHNATITVNGQPVVNKYAGGDFDYVYTLPEGVESETVNIEVSMNNAVSTSYSFTALKYVFVPEPMVLTVSNDAAALKADKNNKVTITGTTVPGATLTAAAAAEMQASVVCGAPVVDAEGKFSFDVTFDKKFYGVAPITIHAMKEGHEEGEIVCNVSRMYANKSAAITGYKKGAGYHEVPAYDFATVMANPTDGALYRFEGKVVSIDETTGIVTLAAKTAKGQTTNIYVQNATARWNPSKNTSSAVKIYCTLNGLYTDGESLFVTAWFNS